MTATQSIATHAQPAGATWLKQTKSRPILFSAPMVRALLDGSKTQTRRVAKPQPIADRRFVGRHYIKSTKRTQGSDISVSAPYVGIACPHGQPGEWLWVRETFGTKVKIIGGGAGEFTTYRATDPNAVYCEAADGSSLPIKWKPSIFMPRSASRITLVITGVRVERLNDISEADCIAEGCTKNHNNYYWGGPHKAGGLKQMATAKQAYQDLWESINGPGSWGLNPWVWVIEFKRVAA